MAGSHPPQKRRAALAARVVVVLIVVVVVVVDYEGEISRLQRQRWRLRSEGPERLAERRVKIGIRIGIG